jgi:murein tripeptide amidase MpaA
MINPDGVIVGNSRLSLNGLDLNREWESPLLDRSPETWSIIEMVKMTQSERDIELLLDIHSYSRQKNIFIFGCNNNHRLDLAGKERIFPLLFSKNCDSFMFDFCRFDTSETRSSTGRQTMRSKFGVINSFTLECSICGPTKGKLAGYHFNIGSMLEMGA